MLPSIRLSLDLHNLESPVGECAKEMVHSDAGSADMDFGCIHPQKADSRAFGDHCRRRMNPAMAILPQ
jgi:hypothetical protein